MIQSNNSSIFSFKYADCFNKKIVILLSLIIGLLILVQFAIKPLLRDKNEFLAASIDKQKRLQQLISPRIVFVGGSNLAFGIDSKRISDSLNIQVVNMGLHGGLGLNYMLKETKENIKSNDIILLSTEYYLSENGNLKLKSLLADSNPKAIFFAAEGMNDFINLYVLNLQTCVSAIFYKVLYTFTPKKEEKIYLRSSFTVEGDNIAHLSNKTKYNLPPEKEFPLDYSAGIRSLNEFIVYAKLKNAKVYYLFPNFPQSYYKSHHKSIERFERQMNNELNCNILNTSKTFLFSDNLCFDSIYHLNREGRQKRTEILIELLNASKITRPTHTYEKQQ